VPPTIPGPKTSNRDDAESLSHTDKEEIDVDARPTPSQKVSPVWISLQKKGEKSESSSKVHVSGNVSILLILQFQLFMF